MAVGQTMPNLNVPIVSGFQIIKPPMEVQDIKQRCKNLIYMIVICLKKC